MADNSNPNEALVLSAGEEVYVIQRQALEQYRVTGDQKAKIERLLGHDVTGYNMEMPLPNPEPNAGNPATTTPDSGLISAMFVMLPSGLEGTDSDGPISDGWAP